MSTLKAGYTVIDLDTLDWSQAESCYRGGTAQARWAQAGETYVKRDGTTLEAHGGEVAVLKADGSIAYVLPKAIADASYNTSALPADKLDMSVVTIHRNPEPVRTLTVSKPTAFVSRIPEDNGAYRYLEPGERIEYNPKGKPSIVPVSASEIATRYISEEEAKRLTASRSAA